MRGADYVIRRAGFALLTIFIAITINFFLFRVLPGNAVTDLSRVPRATSQLRRALTVQFGLDKPKWEQYLNYLKNTIPMVTIGTVGAIVVGILTGILSAWRRGSVSDHVSTNLAIAFYAFPTQFLGLMLLILFGGLLPTSGMENPYAGEFGPESLFARLQDIGLHMTLPALTLLLTLYGEFTLIMRSSMLETLGEDYVLTARAKGLTDRRVIAKHVVRNALLPIATLVALSIGWIVGGAILVEYIFSWPGIGQALWQAINQRDYPMLQGGFLILAVSVVVVNLLADLAYFKLDPRISQ